MSFTEEYDIHGAPLVLMAQLLVEALCKHVKQNLLSLHTNKNKLLPGFQVLAAFEPVSSMAQTYGQRWKRHISSYMLIILSKLI